MSTISEIRQRLQAAAGTPFRLVGGALEFASVKDAPRTTPAAYVLATKDASQPNGLATGPIRQLTERDVMVVIIVRSLADPNGQASGDQLELIKSFVRAELIGFVPTDMEQPITHVGGEVVQAVEGAVWFEDTFSAPIYTRQTA